MMLVKITDGPVSEWYEASSVRFYGPDNPPPDGFCYGLDLAKQRYADGFFVDEGVARIYTEHGVLLDTFDLSGCREKNAQRRYAV